MLWASSSLTKKKRAAFTSTVASVWAWTDIEKCEFAAKRLTHFFRKCQHEPPTNIYAQTINAAEEDTCSLWCTIALSILDGHQNWKPLTWGNVVQVTLGNPNSSPLQRHSFLCFCSNFRKRWSMTSSAVWLNLCLMLFALHVCTVKH